MSITPVAYKMLSSWHLERIELSIWREDVSMQRENVLPSYMKGVLCVLEAEAGTKRRWAKPEESSRRGELRERVGLSRWLQRSVQ